jgi:hypothetical protein
MEIYLDMDGVLYNFEKAMQLAGATLENFATKSEIFNQPIGLLNNGWK